MALGSDLAAEVKDIFKSTWSLRDGTVVPSDNGVGLGNDGVNIDAPVLYAELADSTVLVDTFTRHSRRKSIRPSCDVRRASFEPKGAL